jgi:hypothetical protein
MGCGASRQVSPEPTRHRPVREGLNQLFLPESDASLFAEIDRHFSDITRGVAQLPRPEVICGVACLSNNAMGLVVGHVSVSDGTALAVQMAAVAIAAYGDTRLTCFGSVDMLLRCEVESAEYFLFLENLLTFSVGPRGGAPILVLGMLPAHFTRLERSLNYLGYAVEQWAAVTEPLGRYSVVITLSSSIYGGEIADFLRLGRGVICCADTPLVAHSHTINQHLAPFGLLFTTSQVITAQVKFEGMHLRQSAEELHKWSLPSLITAFEKILEDDASKPGVLENSVSFLRHSICCFERCSEPLLQQLSELSWDYLNKTNYRQEDGLCHSPAQVLVGILLSEIQTKMDPQSIEGNTDLGAIFPGAHHPEALEVCRAALRFDRGVAQATGVWLPAGVISTVFCSASAPPPIFVQIGAHSECLLECPPPWKRWPIATQTFEIRTFPAEIASQFGGLLYVWHEAATRFDEIELKFTESCWAPMWSGADPERWARTKAMTAPWGEIQTQYALFTVPSEYVKDNEALTVFARWFEKLAEELQLFFRQNPPRKFHVVFDVDLPETGSMSTDPIVLSCDAIEGILKVASVTSEMFELLVMMAICMLPESQLDPYNELALGALAAGHTLSKFFKGFSPNDVMLANMSPVFKELWDIYEHHDRRGFAEVLSMFSYALKAGPMNPEESVKFIVNATEKVMDGSFPTLLEKMMSPQGDDRDLLPEYKFDPEPD